ncbi:MAG: hypothetical protein WBW51_07615 [Methyloceanibacter sp.]
MALAACLAWAAPLDAAAAAEPYPGFAWMSGAGDGNAVLTYGSTETGEDYLFSLICGNENKGTDATLYVDVTDTNVGQATVIELAAGGAKVSLKGKIATDEMSGFHFANAKKFKRQVRSLKLCRKRGAPRRFRRLLRPASSTKQGRRQGNP